MPSIVTKAMSHSETSRNVADPRDASATIPVGNGGGLRRQVVQPLAPDGRHYQPFAAASTLNTGRAIPELQIAREADAHFPQSSATAVDGDALRRQSVIRADKGIDDLTRCDA